MSYAPAETWDLDTIFPGGPGGTAFQDAAEAIARRLDVLVDKADALPEHPDPAAFAALLLELEDVLLPLEQLGTFAGCHAAADATGKAAIRAEAKVGELGNRFGRAWVVPTARISQGDEADYLALHARPEIAHMRGMLEEKRRLARFRLPQAEEALSTELARDGLMAWGEQYDLDSGALRIPFDRGNGEEPLSPGQLSSLLSDDDKSRRDAAHAALIAGWRTLSERCAKSLTHITGTRAVLNARRRLAPDDEALAGARIERRTLDAMLEAARRVRPILHDYLARKARMWGQGTLSWADTFALLGQGDGRVSYAEAQEFIVRQFGQFSPAFADFAQRALRESWIEVQDRPNKRGGGFCADVPLTRQSRIFMTWGYSTRSVSTLAHELGHAFHNHVLHDIPVSQRRVPMTLAETASTFAEALVREASLAATSAPGPRLRLLDASLSDSVSFLCNIPARYELELAFYGMRADGPLEVDALEAKTVEIFSAWYGPTVPKVDPTFWSSKLHFYIAGLSFYNFPYLFGALFSNLVYEHFRPLGAAGSPAYERLLRRTGDEWAEPIAREELGVDLGDPETWMKALAPVRRDYEAFVALTAGGAPTAG